MKGYSHYMAIFKKIMKLFASTGKLTQLGQKKDPKKAFKYVY